MKWLYIGFGALGGAIAVGFVVQRTSTYFHNVAEAISHADVDFDIMLIFGLGFGLFFVPVGIGVGILVAFLVNLVIQRMTKKPRPRLDDDMEGGASWVTRRRKES